MEALYVIPVFPVAGLVEAGGLPELVLVFAGGGELAWVLAGGGELEVTGVTGGEDVTGLGALLVSKHWEYQGFWTVQVQPSWHAVPPVQSIPPPVPN
jgi:hypothetical protein